MTTTGLTNASIRFSVRAGGVNVGSAVIAPLLLKGQLINVEMPTLERDSINFTGSGVTTEIIETVLQPMQVTYTMAGWDDQLLELLEMPNAVMEVERWLRTVSGVLVTTGKRIQANWEIATGAQPGFHYRRDRFTGRFRDPRSEAGEQGTAIANQIMVQQCTRMERFNILGGLYRYVDVQTGENLIAPAGTRSTRTDETNTGLIALA